MGEILKGVTTGVTTTGSAGSAAANADSQTFVGEIECFNINYHASAPATTDVVITDKRTGVTLWALNNANTDVIVHPRKFAVDAANAALTNDVLPQRFCVDQGINVSVAQCNALTNAVQVTAMYRR